MLLVLALRWLALSWMLLLAAISGQVQRLATATAVLLVVVCWTGWLTFAAVYHIRRVLAVDLAVAAALLVLSGHVYPMQAMVTNHPTFAGAYPAAAVAAWAVVDRVRGGVVAGLVLACVLPFGYAANGVTLARLSHLQALTLAGWGLSYVLVGCTVGMAAGQLDRLRDQATRSTERASRLAERERLAAQIHDDVVQHLGRIRAQLGDGAPREVIAAGIARQETALRGLANPDLPTPPGVTSLRTQLTELAERNNHLPIVVVADHPTWLPHDIVTELVAAVQELLTNVARHARADQVRLTLLTDGDEIMVSVRDNGVGFDPADAGGRARLGLRLSVNARVTRIGGQVRVRSRPGRGTDVELRVPATLASNADEAPA